MIDLRKNALTYFSLLGVFALLLGVTISLAMTPHGKSGGVDSLYLVVPYELYLVSLAMFIVGASIHIATRFKYTPPPDEVPRARTVVLIPAYNESRTIANVVAEAKKYAEFVIVCDDGSNDGTRQRAEGAGAFVVSHRANLGYGAAVKSLLHMALKAGAEYAVLIDADGQHDPSEIPRLLRPLLEGEADVAVGDRFKGFDTTPFYRRLGIKAIGLVLRMLGVKVSDSENGFRAFNRRALEVLTPKLMDTWMGISSEMIYKAKKLGLRVIEVPVTVRYFHGKRGCGNPIVHGLSVLLNILFIWACERPLRRLIVPGLASSALALCFSLLFEYLKAPVQLLLISLPVLSVFSITTLALGLLTSLTMARVRR